MTILRIAQIVAALFCVVGATRVANAQTSAPPEQLLGNCVAQIAGPKFRPTSEIRVLVTRFAGADGSDDSARFGAALAVAIERLLPQYLMKLLDDDSRKAGMRADRIDPQYVPCLIASHDDARLVGEQWGADLVLWGVAQSTALEDRRKIMAELRQNVAGLRVASNNVINAPGAKSIAVKGVVNVQVHVPIAGATFQTSMTAVAWPGLETNGAGARVSTMLDQDFPRLATANPLALFNLVIGNYAYLTGRFGVAARFFEHAAANVFADAEHQELLYWRVADAYARAGVARDGLQYAKKAVESCPAGDLECSALYLNNLGWMHRELGDAKQASIQYALALDASQASKNTYVEATVRNNQACILMDSDPQAAITLLQGTLPMRRMSGDLVGEGSTLHNIAGAFVLLGQLPQAVQYFTQALPVRRTAGDSSGEAATLRMLGNTYLRQGSPSAALDKFREASVVNSKIGNKRREMLIQVEIWHAAKSLRDEPTSDAAAESFRRLVKADPGLLQRLSTGIELNNVGKMFYDLKEYDRALTMYARARAANQGGGRSDVLDGLLYNNVGKVFLERHYYGLAVEQFQKALPLLAARPGTTYRGFALHNLGLAYDAQNKADEALAAFEASASIRREQSAFRELAETLSALARMTGRRGHVDDAVGYYLDAVMALRACVPPDSAGATERLQEAMALAKKNGRVDLVSQLEDRAVAR